jgi:hypothetical protein
MMCKIRVTGQEGTATTLTCDQMRVVHRDIKDSFRYRNKTDVIEESGRKDIAYEALCKEIDDFLNLCRCK